MTSYNEHSDQQLAFLLAEGNRSAFAEIYERYKGILFVHAYKRLNNQEEAEDIIHDLFAVLWNNRSQLQTSNLAGYLYSSVRNRIFTLLNRKRLESAYLINTYGTLNETDYITDQSVRANELAKIIEQEISILPAKMREIFILSRQQNLNHKEIAHKLGISEQTVAKQITNALRILRIRLKILHVLMFFIGL